MRFQGEFSQEKVKEEGFEEVFGNRFTEKVSEKTLTVRDRGAGVMTTTTIALVEF